MEKCKTDWQMETVKITNCVVSYPEGGPHPHRYGDPGTELQLHPIATRLVVASELFSRKLTLQLRSCWVAEGGMMCLLL